MIINEAPLVQFPEEATIEIGSSVNTKRFKTHFLRYILILKNFYNCFFNILL